METITPTMAPHAGLGIAGKNNATAQRPLEQERVLLFVGAAFPATSMEVAGFRCLVAEDVKGAQQTIAQLLNVYRQIPAVIIFRFKSDYETAFAQWESYFASHKVLRSIPFFLYTEDVSDTLKSFVRKYSFIDEIITKDCLLHQLQPKVDFVNKFKRLHTFMPAQDTEKVIYKGRRVSNFLKRTLDVTVSATALVALSPVMLAVAAAIRMESKGPVFYTSKRAGRNYKIFKFYKFRTMVPDADKKLHMLENQYKDGKGAKFFKVANDPRVTRLGNFLRNSSLDEIPQLLNVLKGDMSLVGNRPLPLYEATTLTTDEWVERFLAPAGITGLWQISKRGKKEMSAEERIGLDIDYAHKNSFAYDMWLMVNTPFAMIQKDNV